MGVAALGCGEVKKLEPDAEIITPPGKPANVVAYANVTLGARITWEPVADATGYELTNLPPGATGRIAGTAAVVTGLTEGQSISFDLVATKNGVTSEAATSTTITIVNGPAAPTGVIACGADSEAMIHAPAVSGAATYTIYFAGDDTASMLSTTKVVSTTLPYKHTAQANGQAKHYVVTATNAAGVESIDTAKDTTTPDSVVHDMMAASTYGTGNKIEVIDCFSKWASGTTVPARTIVGALTTIGTDNYNNVAIDAANARIYYRNQTSILVFNDATRVTGNVAPSRTITSAALTNGGGIALDPTRDILYVAESENTILVFTNISTASGAVTPARQFTISGVTSNVQFLTLDPDADRLYIPAYTIVCNIAGASSASGSVSCGGITLSGQTMTSFGVAVDPASSLLYVGLRNAQTISAIPSSAVGSTTPSRVITGLNTPMQLAISNNRLFMMSDNSSNRIDYWDMANMVDGATASKFLLFPTLTSASGFSYIR